MLRPSALLIVMSIVSIVFGVILLFFSAFLALNGIAVGGLFASSSTMLALEIFSLAGGPLFLLCGVFGVKAKKLKACFIMALVIIIAQASNLILAYGYGDYIFIGIIIVFTILYIYGIKQTKQMGEMNMSKWIELFNEITNTHEYCKPNPPATIEQISKVEKTLGNKLPADLKELLLCMNGDDWLIFSTEQIIETNIEVRKMDFYMPLDCLLFFGGNGCGDYYGYPITREMGVRHDNVFIWSHESDDRMWRANDLEDIIRKYYNSDI